MKSCLFVMDPIEKINPKKEATYALFREAQQKNIQIYYAALNHLGLRDDTAYGLVNPIHVFEREKTPWYQLDTAKLIPLKDFDIIFMRKDPPVNAEYIYTSYILEFAEKNGVLVINSPQAFRNVNEKIFLSHLAEFCPPTLISANINLIQTFIDEQKEVVIKPVDLMGGQQVFYLREDDINRNVAIETLTNNGTHTIITQRFIPEVKFGSRRIVIINGDPLPQVLARIPAKREIRGNLVLGATGVPEKITEHELKICRKLKPILQQHGLFFVGIDMIGDYLTEINITSVGIIQETDAAFGINISKLLFEAIEKKLKK